MVRYSESPSSDLRIKRLKFKMNYHLIKNHFIYHKTRTVIIRFNAPGRLSKFEVLRGAINRGGAII